MLATPPLQTNGFDHLALIISQLKTELKYMKKLDVEKDEKTEELEQQSDETPQDSIFDTEEIRIEELAIDGVCGVY
jgi:mycofactocin precursor